MAASIQVSQSSSGVLQTPSLITCIKRLAESPDLKSVPSVYAYSINPSENAAVDADDSIPIIDYSLLTSDEPTQQSKAIDQLGKACQDWGFFILVNHGIPEKLRKAVIDGCNEFFNLKEEEKKEFEAKHVLDPIRYGTSFNTAKENVFFWRDFLKVFVHPEFHFPNKPAGFSEISLEYVRRIREVAGELLKAISLTLGLEKCYIERATNLESGLQILIANLYPPCPQPDLAMGMPPHSDHGFLSILTENEMGGLQIQHNGKWFNVNALPNSFLVNTGDQLEVLSNGKYKSVLHRAIVNNKATRISLVITNGPSLDTTISPASGLVDADDHPPLYTPMKYREYLEQQQGNRLNGKSCLDLVRVKRE